MFEDNFIEIFSFCFINISLKTVLGTINYFSFCNLCTMTNSLLTNLAYGRVHKISKMHLSKTLFINAGLAEIFINILHIECRDAEFVHAFESIIVEREELGPAKKKKSGGRFQWVPKHA